MSLTVTISKAQRSVQAEETAEQRKFQKAVLPRHHLRDGTADASDVGELRHALADGHAGEAYRRSHRFLPPADREVTEAAAAHQAQAQAPSRLLLPADPQAAEIPAGA